MNSMLRRLLPPQFVLLCIFGMTGLHFLVPMTQLLALPFNLLGLVPLMAGLGLCGSASRMFLALGTNIQTFNEPGRLVREGLFRHSRNPMYLGFTLGLLGIALLFGSASTLVGPVVFFATANLWYIPFEERAMAAKFGDDYTAYRLAVRRWI
jgi:protein-S-isoprenylcysteine O-methyltransferase Ste14